MNHAQIAARDTRAMQGCCTISFVLYEPSLLVVPVQASIIRTADVNSERLLLISLFSCCTLYVDWSALA